MISDAEIDHALYVARRDPVEFCKRWLEWEPHSGQVRWLRASRKSSTAILVAGRRWGKSYVAAAQALYYALRHPGSRQCIISITLDQARIPFDTIISFCSSSIAQALVKSVREVPFPTLDLINKSQITVRSGSREGVYIRGHKFHRVIVDEADYLSPRLVDEVIRMTLADVGGQLVMLSTPRDRRGVVFRELQRALSGDEKVYAQQGPTWENPHIDHDYILSLREHMTAAAWQREVEGMYVDDDTAVFKWQDIREAFEKSTWKLPEESEVGKRYVAGWDLAKSVDYTVCCVLDATNKPYRLVYFERFQRRPWPVVAERIRYVHQRYNCHQTLIDATGVGDAVLDEVRDIASGFVFTQKSKLNLITDLQLALERRELQFPFVRELVDELQGYAWDDKNLQTDCVMALALALYAARSGSVQIDVLTHEVKKKWPGGSMRIS